MCRAFQRDWKLNQLTDGQLREGLSSVVISVKGRGAATRSLRCRTPLWAIGLRENKLEQMRRRYHSAHPGSRAESKSAPRAALASRGAVRATLGGVGGGREALQVRFRQAPAPAAGRAVMASPRCRGWPWPRDSSWLCRCCCCPRPSSRGKRQGRRGAKRAGLLPYPAEGEHERLGPAGGGRGGLRPARLRGAKRQGSLGPSGQRRTEGRSRPSPAGARADEPGRTPVALTSSPLRLTQLLTVCPSALSQEGCHLNSPF